ncbi:MULTISPECIES: acyl-CoA dehydratase activase [unclassified Dehalobacter]|uniref:acyl-CoA dehydratase activase n=1 Tax=unclassified Dehalobacter TaxID=2635733 RepID=UPI000E6BE9A7|nr:MULTISPECIES: acyl-CoA dehydratase activase [unclassified Dehalobacter]RJE48206.1 2-hydroxyglutaryl-CoA dehydratase [Dehalobacter sp. MCB1]TCX49684.1 2-hydroxyglutaryl-CoA dehydratase [Dehalobacter sp. 14DCB1]TCX50193.1 2-hydroxyglutaryl-CoA dehydratase [Dehalobacter sp. 12DCB1]
MKWTVGIDIGSVSTKAVLFNGEQVDSKIIPSGWSPSQAGQEVLERLLKPQELTRDDISLLVGTGYGRIQQGMFDKTFSEITCHARGVHYLLPEACGLIDIGGQDSKVIGFGEKGKVEDFVLNDKCAAGTGRFLQVTAQTLGLEVSQLSDLAEDADPADINSMCAVFAESEIIGLLAQGITIESIVAGLLKSIAKRISVMAGKIHFQDTIAFCGGVAQNQVLKNLLSQEIGCRLAVPPSPQAVGALGAAILGYEL